MCIFCKIINNEIPSKKIYEDDDILAILDISQITYGHTLVMPKKHYNNMFDIDENTLTKLMTVVNKISKEYRTKGIEGLNIYSNCEAIAGQEVMHLHFHILPRYNKDEFTYKHQTNKYDLDEVLNKMKL